MKETTLTELAAEDRALVDAARAARDNAYVPYSRFRVGAAVRTASGRVYRGCNIENKRFSVTNCAERTAMFSAVSDGNLAFEAIAIIADTNAPVTPCGACRQVLAEFHVPRVLMANMGGDIIEATGAEILPLAFDETSL